MPFETRHITFLKEALDLKGIQDALSFMKSILVGNFPLPKFAACHTVIKPFPIPYFLSRTFLSGEVMGSNIEDSKT